MTVYKSEKQRAFEGEALAHADLLYNFALRMTGNPADADDLVQETYLKAYRFWDKYEQGTNIRAWLFRIATNLAIDRIRYCTLPFVDPGNRSETSVDADEQIEDRNTWTGERPYSAEQLLIHGEMTACIRSCLENLPEPYRVVTVTYDGKPFRDGFGRTHAADASFASLDNCAAVIVPPFLF